MKSWYFALQDSPIIAKPLPNSFGSFKIIGEVDSCANTPILAWNKPSFLDCLSNCSGGSVVNCDRRRAISCKMETVCVLANSAVVPIVGLGATRDPAHGCTN